MLVGQILTAIAVVIAFISLRKTQEMTRWTKRIDTTSSYMSRWGELMEELTQVLEGKVDINYFWLRFWYLQQEQFILWKRGLIDEDIYEIWMDYRRQEWKNDCLFRLKNYRKGFSGVARSLIPEFRMFMESIFSGRSIEEAKKSASHQ